MLICPRGYEFNPMIIVRDVWNAFMDFLAWVFLLSLLLGGLVLFVDLVLTIGQWLTYQVRVSLLWIGLGMFLVPVVIAVALVFLEKNNTLPNRY